jgi:2-polyprenyl-3-methyl-5-hydroxy-6-metoxy-1,4-benzoquinol methylase
MVPDHIPWQIEMFQRSIKKRQKLRALLNFLGDLTVERCLLVTCGDNNGALNWYFRSHGGDWTWADVAGENNDQISTLLNEPVHAFRDDDFPFLTGEFDRVVSIDVLEHLSQDQPFLEELGRVLSPGGIAVVTVPNGDQRLLANRIKWLLGMTPEVYGHTRAGYTVSELSDALRVSGLEPQATGGYSRFMTEMIELVINFVYVRVLAKRYGDAQAGHIAPVSSSDLRSHGLAYRAYSLVFFPLAVAISMLDHLLPARTNNAVIVSARKPDRT